MLLRPLLDEPECIDRCLGLRSGQKLADCVALPAVALFDGPGLRALDQVECGVRSRRCAVDGVVDVGASAAKQRFRFGPVGRRPLEGLRRELARERKRFVDELHRLEEPIGDPELGHLRTGEHAVLAQRVRDDHLDRRLRSDEPRQELRAAPRRKEAEEDLRKGEVPNCSRHRARRAVQGELDATAETCAVDRRDGRERQRAQAPEQLVSRTCAFDRTVTCDVRELGDVGACREEERLAGDHRRAVVRAFELSQQPVERLERLLAEERRLRPVLAVVDRDERDVARTRELELSDRRQGSPTREPRPYPSRRTAPSVRSAHRDARRTRTRAAPSASRPSLRADARRRSRRRTG